MPAIFDSLFHKVVNTTSIPIGVVRSHEVAGSSNTKTFYGQMALIQAVFSSTCLKMKLHRYPVSPASPVVIPCRLSALPGKLEPFTDYPSIRGRQTGP